MDGCSLNAIGSGEACTIDAVFSPTALQARRVQASSSNTMQEVTR